MKPINDCEWQNITDGTCCHRYNLTPECHIAACPRLASFVSDLLATLEELVDLVEDARQGEYEIDYFTTQPGRKAIAKAKGETEGDQCPTT